MQNRWLLIDDDPDDREVFAIALAEVNKKVELLEAGDGAEGLQLLKGFSEKELPRIIFMDLNMPRMHGHECLVQIRRQKHLDSLPVIIYTTSTDEKDRETAFNAGATEYISKPAELDLLVKVLAHFNEKYQ